MGDLLKQNMGTLSEQGGDLLKQSINALGEQGGDDSTRHELGGMSEKIEKILKDTITNNLTDILKTILDNDTAKMALKETLISAFGPEILNMNININYLKEITDDQKQDIEKALEAYIDKIKEEAGGKVDKQKELNQFIKELTKIDQGDSSESVNKIKTIMTNSNDSPTSEGTNLRNAADQMKLITSGVNPSAIAGAMPGAIAGAIAGAMPGGAGVNTQMPPMPPINAEMLNTGKNMANQFMSGKEGNNLANVANQFMSGKEGNNLANVANQFMSGKGGNNLANVAKGLISGKEGQVGGKKRTHRRRSHFRKTYKKKQKGSRRKKT